eukprot:COSAG02_NODE_3445_length_6730_cov_4.938772_5_plen_142_part_00
MSSSLHAERRGAAPAVPMYAALEAGISEDLRISCSSAQIAPRSHARVSPCIAGPLFADATTVYTRPTGPRGARAQIGSPTRPTPPRRAARGGALGRGVVSVGAGGGCAHRCRVHWTGTDAAECRLPRCGDARVTLLHCGNA